MSDVGKGRDMAEARGKVPDTMQDGEPHRRFCGSPGKKKIGQPLRRQAQEDNGRGKAATLRRSREKRKGHVSENNESVERERDGNYLEAL